MKDFQTAVESLATLDLSDLDTVEAALHCQLSPPSSEGEVLIRESRSGEFADLPLTHIELRGRADNLKQALLVLTLGAGGPDIAQFVSQRWPEAAHTAPSFDVLDSIGYWHKTSGDARLSVGALQTQRAITTIIVDRMQ